MRVSPLSPSNVNPVAFSTCRPAAPASVGSVEDPFESPRISPGHGGGRAGAEREFLYVLRSSVKRTVLRALTGFPAACRYVWQYLRKIIPQKLTPGAERFAAMPREHQMPAAACPVDRHRVSADIVPPGSPLQNPVFLASCRTDSLDTAMAKLLPPERLGQAATAPSTAALLTVSTYDEARQFLRRGLLAATVDVLSAFDVRGIKRVWEMHAARREAADFAEDLRSYRDTLFTRPSVFCPEQRSVQQCIAHYWRQANGDLIEWIASAAHLELPALQSAADLLRHACASGLTQPVMLAEIRWFVEDFTLQPDEPFAVGEDGIRAAKKLIKVRKLAVHPDKFEARAPYAHPERLDSVRALLDLVDAVRECIDDPVLAPLVMNVTRESEDSVR